MKERADVGKIRNDARMGKEHGYKMEKKYEDKLLKALKDRQELTDYHGAPLLVKNLPDCDEKGAMDPRLYQDMKTQLKIMGWMPKKFMKMDTSEKGIANLRKMFNGVKSIPCVETDIYIENRTVPAKDGYLISIPQDMKTVTAY